MDLAERVQRGRRAILLAKRQGLNTADWRRHLALLLESAGLEPANEGGLQPWMLWEWRRVTTPEWRRVLTQSIDDGDSTREEYARWMLREILLDPEYSDQKQ